MKSINQKALIEAQWTQKLQANYFNITKNCGNKGFGQ
jgi:hypothetical protein